MVGERKYCGEEQAKSQGLPVSPHSGPRWKKLKTLRDTSFRPTVKAILQSIIMRESRDDGLARTGRLQIAKDAGVSLRQVGRYLPKLQRCGLVQIRRRYNTPALRRVSIEKLELAESSPLALNEKDILPLSRPKGEKAILSQRKGHPGTPERDILSERKGHPQHTKTVLKTVSQDCSEDCGAKGADSGSGASALALRQKKLPVKEEDGNSFSFNGRFLKVTPEMEREIAQFLPSTFERNAQLTALDETLTEAPADPVAAVQSWVKNQKAAQLRDALRSQGWIR
jgi:hypothetical protein